MMDWRKEGYWYITSPEGGSDGPFDTADMAHSEADIANNNYLAGWDTWSVVYMGPNGPEPIEDEG